MNASLLEYCSISALVIRTIQTVRFISALCPILLSPLSAYAYHDKQLDLSRIKPSKGSSAILLSSYPKPQEYPGIAVLIILIRLTTPVRLHPVFSTVFSVFKVLFYTSSPTAVCSPFAFHFSSAWCFGVTQYPAIHNCNGSSTGLVPTSVEYSNHLSSMSSSITVTESFLPASLEPSPSSSAPSFNRHLFSRPLHPRLVPQTTIFIGSSIRFSLSRRSLLSQSQHFAKSENRSKISRSEHTSPLASSAASSLSRQNCQQNSLIPFSQRENMSGLPISST